MVANQIFAVANGPNIDGMFWVMLVSRVLHIVGAIILVGGLFYLRTVVAPSEPTGDAWFAGRRAAWAKWVGIATLLLLATGIWNYLQIIKVNERMASSYHMLLGIKMLLALALFFVASLLSGRTPLAEKLRANMKSWLGACVALGFGIVILAAMLRAYPHVPKHIDAGPDLEAPANDLTP